MSADATTDFGLKIHPVASRDGAEISGVNRFRSDGRHSQPLTSRVNDATPAA